MKRLAMAFVAAVVLAGSVAVMAASPAVVSGDQDFTLGNKTGLTIDELYVSPTGVNNWEEDVLGVETLANGDHVDIKFHRDEDSCAWDLKIVDQDGDAVVWNKLDLCKASEITLVYANGKPTAIIK